VRIVEELVNIWPNEVCDIIETPADIQFCEILGSAELGDEFGDEGERIFILNSYSVQSTVVLD